MSETPQITFTHGELGEIVGVQRHNDIVQFRGIPYAQIPGRFRQSILLTSLPKQPFDAREPGPICPQTALPFPDYLDCPLAEDGIPLQAPVADELNCLSLNITIPQFALEQQTKARLPVLFFIHGGAFLSGSASLHIAGRELFDGYSLVKKSVERGQPIAFVCINYRLGTLGFLTSRELQVFNNINGEKAGNYGLRDQRQALEWCHKFIGGFGGDPDQVTITGSSAGAASCEYQLRYPNPRFRRAVLSSGSMTGLGPGSSAFHQAIFEYAAEKISGENLATSDDKLEKLLNASTDQVVKGFPPLLWSPWAGDEELTLGTNICDRSNGGPALDIMAGSCYFEEEVGYGMLSMPVSNINTDTGKLSFFMPSSDPELQTAHMQNAMAVVFKPSKILKDATNLPASNPDIRRAYGIVDKPSEQDLGVVLQNHARLLTDALLRLPPLHLSQKLDTGGDFFLYEMQTTSPYPKWPGVYGVCNHAANDTFLFNVAPDAVPDHHRDDFNGAVDEITAAWLNFTYGKQPWKPVDKSSPGNGPVYVFRNGTRSGLWETFDEAVGEEQARRLATLKPLCYCY